MNYRIIYMDAFTDKVFSGNPCAVVPEAEGLSDDQMQAIARETNLSETAFVFASSKADFRVRYFMPHTEIPFAGHPTIATAFALAEEGKISLDNDVTTVSFEFNIGVLPVDVIRKPDGGPERVVMTQNAPEFGASVDRELLADAFRLETSELAANTTAQVVSTGVSFLIVCASDLKALKKADMNREKLKSLLKDAGVAASYMFALEGIDPDSDFHARLLAPGNSFEDPFTGAAAGALGAYVVQKGLKTGSTFKLEQGDMLGRPGRGAIEVIGSPEGLSSVKIGGPAVRSMVGEILVS